MEMSNSHRCRGLKKKEVEDNELNLDLNFLDLAHEKKKKRNNHYVY